MSGPRTLVLSAGLLALLPAPAPAAAPAAGKKVRIDVLSNRADLISGGRALLEVKLPKSVNVWQTYQRKSGKVIYGGRPMGRAPRHSGLGWSSPSFKSWRTFG